MLDVWKCCLALLSISFLCRAETDEGKIGSLEVLPWLSLRPLDLKQIPDSTRILSEKLKALPPEDAFFTLVKAWKEADAELNSVEIEASGLWLGSSFPYRHWHWRWVNGKGYTYTGGMEPADQDLIWWGDFQKGLNVKYDTTHRFYARWGLEPGYIPGRTTLQTMAFPIQDMTPNLLFPGIYKRQGDLLVVMRGNSTFWIDLSSLAILVSVHSSDSNQYYVKTPTAYQYLEGWPFPVPKTFTTTSYRKNRKYAPLKLREQVLELKVTLNGSHAEEFLLPAAPSFRSEGTHKWGNWWYQVSTHNADKHQTEPYQVTRLEYQCPHRNYRPEGQRISSILNDPVPGREINTPWGAMRWEEEGALQGWRPSQKEF